MLTLRTGYFLVGFFCAISTSAARAESHLDHLWSADQKAFQSYRESPLKRQQSPHFNGAATIDTKYLVDSLTQLSGEKDPILSNRGKKTGRVAARQFLKDEFASFGFTVSEHNYGSGSNLIAEKKGKSGKILIVSAHYDSVNNAGADDDGTGVVAMLATAKLLQHKTLKNTVRFVAFDEEEIGLVGSSAYAKLIIKEGEKAKILGDLQMEMMGYNSRNDGKFHVISCDRADSKFMVDAFNAAVTRLGTGLEITSSCTDRSDHAAFWKNGMPAIVMSENFFGGDSNPCYHKLCDKMDRMNLSYFEKVAEASANVVAALVTD